MNRDEFEHSFKKGFNDTDDDAWFCWDTGKGSYVVYFLIAAEHVRLGRRDEVELARLIKATPTEKERYDRCHATTTTQAFQCVSYARVYILAKSEGKSVC